MVEMNAQLVGFITVMRAVASQCLEVWGSVGGCLFEDIRYCFLLLFQHTAQKEVFWQEGISAKWCADCSVNPVSF